MTDTVSICRGATAQGPWQTRCLFFRQRSLGWPWPLRLNATRNSVSLFSLAGLVFCLYSASDVTVSRSILAAPKLFFSWFLRFFSMSQIFWATISTVTVTKATQRAVRYRDRCSPTYQDSNIMVPGETPFLGNEMCVAEANPLQRMQKTWKKKCPWKK
jgi:hypothetical protein